MRNALLLLTVLGVVLPALPVKAADENGQIQEFQQFLHTKLQNREDHYGATSKVSILDPEYQGDADLYKGAGLRYPKVVRLHTYDHTPQLTPLVLQLPSQVLNYIPGEVIEKYSNGVPKDNIKVFFVAQTIDAIDDEQKIQLKPHYYVDNLINGNDAYNVETNVSASLFPLIPQSSKVKLQYNFHKKPVSSSISTHPGDWEGLIASPPKVFQLNNFKNKEEAFLCSIVTVNHGEKAKRKSAITFHYLPGEENYPLLQQIVEKAETVSDLLQVPVLRGLWDKEAIEEYFLGTFTDKSSEDIIDMDYLPLDFNPAIYLHLHPGLAQEAEKEQMDPIKYAIKQFVTWGWNHNHYLPLDFNPALYLHLHPGLAQEAEKEQIDPLLYAKKHFASWGWNHNHYLPLDFTPEGYIGFHPGLVQEAEKEQMDPLLYAKKHFATFGWVNGLQYK